MRKLLYLGIGFGLIALAQLATIMTKFVLYYDTTFTRQIGEAIVTYHLVQSVDIFYQLGFFFYRLLTLLGFYIIYKLPLEKGQKEDFFLVLFFITVISILSKDLIYLFYFTALILLILITKNYYLVYKKNKSRKTLLLIFAFGILALSNVIYAFSGSSPFYVVADGWELVSYIILLVLIIRIFKYGKKKKPDGYNIGHTWNSTREGRAH